uniref:Uncharacterized protein n=1 Tax=Solanum lycopersicum TaxID=4081 RepID=A0A3Q7G1N4_SOLLC
MFEKDEIFVPKQTSWFWYYPDGSFTTLSPDQKVIINILYVLFFCND